MDNASIDELGGGRSIAATDKAVLLVIYCRPTPMNAQQMSSAPLSPDVAYMVTQKRPRYSFSAVT